jgi:hypothetical protein
MPTFIDVTGQTNNYVLFGQEDLIWNGAIFEAYVLANYGNYDIPATEIGATGIYQFDLPSVPDGSYYFVAKRGTGTPAPGDLVLWHENILQVPTDAGTGARTVVITVEDAATDPIQNAQVRVTLGSESFIQLTDVNGEVTFNLDDGSWTVAITRFGYSFAGATLVVNGNENVTYTMTLTVPPPFGGAEQVTAYLYTYNENGAPEVGVEVRSYAKALSPITDEQAAILYGFGLDSTVRVAVSDGTGLVSIPGLFKGVTYGIWRGPANSGREFEVQIPEDATDPYTLPSIIGAP